jgi:hypothetical protein
MADYTQFISDSTKILKEWREIPCFSERENVLWTTQSSLELAEKYAEYATIMLLSVHVRLWV